uniref:Uncharacterized protein n=1 Tax=uncultured organism MedDCM-OCT-S05-C26 TaxID=743623 RepID=D6PKE4_9ZZZZ|nr:hypothetical protein [uncultured organism MedDCM-OCT-S05-C26]
MQGMMLRMSPFSCSLMKHINDRSPGFYDPEHRSPKTNGIIVAIFASCLAVLFGSASLRLSTLNSANIVSRVGNLPAKN